MGEIFIFSTNRSQMKLASKMRQYISTLPVFLSFRKFCVAQTFFVERHLDVVLEVLQVVGSKYLFSETCRYLP